VNLLLERTFSLTQRPVHECPCTHELRRRFKPRLIRSSGLEVLQW
jgi:hypothetical protein